MSEKLIQVILGEDMKDKTVLMTTNNQNYIKYAERVLYLEDGRIAFDGSYKQFYASRFYDQMKISEKKEEDLMEVRAA